MFLYCLEMEQQVYISCRAPSDILVQDLPTFLEHHCTGNKHDTQLYQKH